MYMFCRTTVCRSCRGFYFYMDQLIYYASAIVAVIFVFAPHEFAHAYVAYKCGDPTAKMRGRMTLNPLKHIDVYGFIACILVGFGWAKPVPIDPYNFRNYRRGLFLTSVAGVVANYIIAFFAYPLLLLVGFYFPVATPPAYYLYLFLEQSFLLIFIFSLSVFIFNLLPFNPLDGFRIVQSLTREMNPVHRFLKNYGQYILIAVVLESFLCGILESYTNFEYARYFDILGYVQWFSMNILGYPIRLLWNAIFGLGIPSLMPYGIPSQYIIFY